MPNARVTQAGVAVLGATADTAAARVTQAGVAVLGYAPPPAVQARVTQAGIAVLARGVPCVTAWAVAWIIRRTDAVVLGFTSLDVPIDVQGVTCQPCHSLAAGAIELAAPLGSVGNQEVTGLIDDSAISEADLFAGRYDDAQVEIWQVPWLQDPADAGRALRDPAADLRRIALGRIGRVSQGDVAFDAEVLTDGAALEQTALVEPYTPACRFRQYGTRCGLSLATHLVSGTVTSAAAASVYNQAARRNFFDTGRTEPSGTFDGARTMTWLTGANAGLTSEVKTWDLPTGRFTLWDALPNPIAVGDTYEVAPTCGQTDAGCKAFSNYARFGGFRDVPGQDEVLKSPDARVG